MRTDASSVGSVDLQQWEVVIGLEVHAELSTRTKLFSSATNEFGGEPNTHIDALTLGLPGSLPVLNERAVELAIRVGLALNCTVQRSVFARKNYFYPDQSKNYQISQFDLPINVDGWLELPDGTIAGIERAHLEEDTGKSTHVGGGGRIHDAEHSLVDYNRAGVPLLEIVGRPDLRTPEQARAYVAELRSVLVAVGASDGKMEEGSLRVDCNVSVRARGSDELGIRCEIKNINSLRSLGRAIEYEAARQVDLITAGERVEQQTRHWNEDEGRTHKLRSKEGSDDYRYFPDPDLVVLDPGEEWIERVRAALPLLPAQRRRRLAEHAGVPLEHAALTVERGLDQLVLDAIGHGADPARAMTHAEQNLSDERARELDPAAFAELIRMESAGELSSTQTKTVLAEMVDGGGAPGDIASSHGFEAMDTGELDALLDGIIAANPDEWERFCGGDGKVTGFFVGQIMKATQGKADGKVVTALLNSRRPS
uniref:Aspartyl/glutamyl-tRNA(Asn/Gln) amidotransferase subunit B n=1 Tax=uncultured bacterium A1Q1_fos_568 TaxID=1256586 RepID=L7VYG7_9BACT|nr:aspartyl-tRNA(Asn) amidotransferase subunit B amidotransferase subunit B [uncultured bacterium A1Q1_fos_568]